MKKKNLITEIDDQKIFLNFLNNLKNEEQNLEDIKNLFDLMNVWESSAPFTQFREKIDKKILELLPAFLADLPTKLEFFLPEISEIIRAITPDSENENLVLQKIQSILQKAEEKDWAILIVFYQKWSNFKKGQDLLFEKIKSILEVKSAGELIEFRCKNEYNKPIVSLVDKILADNLPKILPRTSSVSFLCSFLEKFYYECKPKRLIEERLVEIFKNNFLFSVFSFEELYKYWKSFSNRSEGQKILLKAIDVEIESMKSLSPLFKNMNLVDRIDIAVRKLFYQRISDLTLKIGRGSADYDFFLKIISEDIEKRNLPEELIEVFKKKAEEFLLN